MPPFLDATHRMRIKSVIEFAHISERELPLELLDVAYRASESGAVVLVFPPALRVLVDRLLDPIVQRVGPTSCGIRYVEATDDAAIRSALGSAACAVTSDAAFRRRCQALGVPVISANAAIARLRTGDVGRASEPRNSPVPASGQQVAVAG